MAELTLELKSDKDDYDMLCRGLVVKIERLEKCVEKGNLLTARHPSQLSLGTLPHLPFMYFPFKCNVPSI